MLVVIEGLDRTGKTTLAREVSKQTGAQYMHFGAPTRHPIDEYLEPVLGYRPGSGRHIVMDRGYLGELVWPTIFGRQSMMTETVRKIIEVYLQRKCCLLVLAQRPVDDVIADCLRDGEPVDEAQVRWAHELFELAYRESPLFKTRAGEAVNPQRAAEVVALARNIEEEMTF
jgi:hypothetical protein